MKITERQLRRVIRQIISEDAVINNDQNLINEGHTKKAIEAALLAAGIVLSASQIANFAKNLNDPQVTSNYSGDSLRAAYHAGELDDAGKRSAEKFYEAFPEKLFYVPMSKHKDANDFLMAGDEKDLMWSAVKPQRYSPDNFFCSDEEVKQAILNESPYDYTPIGHTGLDDKIRGIVKGGLTFIKAPRGKISVRDVSWSGAVFAGTSVPSGLYS